MCLFKDYGYEVVVNQLSGDNTVLPSKGRFDVRVENTGETSLFIGGVGEIVPGSEKCIGISQVPCAVDLAITYASDESGTLKKQCTVYSNRLVCMDWNCLNG
ncbi:MAG: hypothetical protein PSX81_02720 [bacterium]|nr:hypothetical protein [bacterium]